MRRSHEPEPSRKRTGPPSHRGRRGFTMIELLSTMTIVGILASVATMRSGDALVRARLARAAADLSALSRELATMDSLPPSLAAIGRGNQLDPWGNPYQYKLVLIDPLTGSVLNAGQLRKDRFLVQVNSRFDLYSMGPDGRTALPLTSALGQDDIIVGNDGGFIGVAADY